jgi:hypothetical protein
MEGLKKAFETVFTASLFLIENQLSQCTLKKNQDPDIKITELRN